MTARTAPAAYRVEELRKAPDGLPLLGIRRPDGTWYQSMGTDAYYYSPGKAQERADELNRHHGLGPDGSADT
ncbi:hypothetical protein [Kitasatospora phosalacinea]|uniref:DUF4102 domain-containing protein n=1 Tax=Kitasatospora phosalacinea TaxID=2065 RepID=A0ABW6GRI8_9ACTN